MLVWVFGALLAFFFGGGPGGGFVSLGGGSRVGRFWVFGACFWAPKTRRFLSLQWPACFGGGSSGRRSKCIGVDRGWVGACGDCAPTPATLWTLGLGVVGVRGGACIIFQFCLSFKVETEQVRARCGTSSARLRLGRAELRFDG